MRSLPQDVIHVSVGSCSCTRALGGSGGCRAALPPPLWREARACKKGEPGSGSAVLPGGALEETPFAHHRLGCGALLSDGGSDGGDNMRQNLHFYGKRNKWGWFTLTPLPALPSECQLRAGGVCPLATLVGTSHALINRTISLEEGAAGLPSSRED